MPEIVPQDELEFLRDVARLAREGKSLTETAELKGVAPGTITYRLMRRGLAWNTTADVVDRRTGETIDQLLDRGEIVVDVPQPIAA